jgi:LDH2 family malate/lactate/ureidoglycolate dehydrogenase
MPLSEFRARIDRLVDHVKTSELASGVEEVLIAGEPEARRKADRLRDGIPLSAVVLQELRDVAQSLDVGAELG